MPSFAPVRHGPWQPTLGALPAQHGVRFRVWAPAATSVRVIFEPPGPDPAPLERASDGTFAALIAGATAGNRYRYEIDGGASFPDPASRCQPEGVHGPSEIVDPRRFTWTDTGWNGIAPADLVLYELHVGVFTPEGTYLAAAQRLPYLAQLGVTAVELMPVADFPGHRNWGYDGVDLFAPARCYGSPDDLRRFVNDAHALGLAVFLDVVYNHLGPDGNYLSRFSPHYFSDTDTNPWGKGLNFDGPGSSMVRRFFIENALHWVHEYHVDGLRLDATHAIIDSSPRPFVAELAARVKESTSRHVYVIAEDHGNQAQMIRPVHEGGWGLDGVWADDFHHQVRVALAGDTEGYYGDYSGSMPDLSRTLNQGWYFTGQYSTYLQEHRGTDPAGLPPRRFVFCIQNHDQVGNRALGDRLNHQIDIAAYRAASALLLCAPATPLLFMGQEWAATSPFQYFTDHPEELGALVTAGRRNEFRHFSAFADPAARGRIPDPQHAATFAASRLAWPETRREPHASTLRLYERLLAFRREATPLRRGTGFACPQGESTLLIRYDVPETPSLLAIVHLKGFAEIQLARRGSLAGLDPSRWQLILTTEDPAFAPDAQPLHIEPYREGLTIAFTRPSAVLLSMWRATPTLGAGTSSGNAA